MVGQIKTSIGHYFPPIHLAKFKKGKIWPARATKGCQVQRELKLMHSLWKNRLVLIFMVEIHTSSVEIHTHFTLGCIPKKNKNIPGAGVVITAGNILNTHWWETKWIKWRYFQIMKHHTEAKNVANFDTVTQLTPVLPVTFGPPLEPLCLLCCSLEK